MSDHDCPSDLLLERALAGDLAAPQTHQLETCARCKARLAEMRRDGDAYMASEAADVVRSEISGREKGRSPRLVWWSAAVPLALAAAWIIFSRPPHPAELAAKGAPTVEIFVGQGETAVPWKGAPLAEGDKIQLSWTSPRPGFVCVIGREGSGETVQWFPTGDRAVRVEAGVTTLGDSLRFDPPFHGVVHVFVAEASFDIPPLVRAIRDGEEPHFPGDAHTILIPKAP